MKILMTLSGLGIGDTQTYVTELSRQLVFLGHEVIIVSENGAYSEICAASGVKLVTAPLSGHDIKSVSASFKILKKIISEEKPDIVHAHSRISAFVCHLVRYFVRFTLVTTAHTDYKVSFALKLFSRWGKKTMAVSTDVKKYLKDSYGLKNKRIFLSSNGIDINRFSPDNAYENILDNFGFSRGAKRLVYMNLLDEDECAPLFMMLDFFEALENAHPGLELLIIGDGDATKKLSKRAKEINIRLSRNAVMFTGTVLDVPLYLAMGDVAIGSGRAILECMSMGKPSVVVSQKGYIGILDRTTLDIAVETNFTCRHRMDTQSDKFKEDILSLLDMSNEERLTLGAFGRSVVKEKYSLDKMVEDNLLFYDSVITTKHYDCSILGYYGFKNSGDDTLLFAMVNSLKEANPDVKINVFSFAPKDTAKTYGVNSVSRYAPLKTHKAIKNSELFILGGGSIIQDVTSTKSLIYYLFMVCRALRHKIPVMLYANGIGPINKPHNRKLVRKVLNKVSLITLRDENSLKELKAMGVNKPEIIVTADPVFAIKAKNPQKADSLLKNSGMGEDEKFAILSVRKWSKLPEDFDEKFAALADYISEKHGLTPLFLPLHYPFDASASRKIISKMKSKALFISGRPDIPTTLSLVEKSQLTVSIRLHTLIYASCSGVPSVGISYDPKVVGFQDSVDQPSVTPEEFSPKVYEKIIDEQMENYEEIRQKLLTSAEILKEKANITAQLAHKLMR